MNESKWVSSIATAALGIAACVTLALVWIPPFSWVMRSIGTLVAAFLLYEAFRTRFPVRREA